MPIPSCSGLLGPVPVATPSLPPISPLRGLLEVTKLVRAEGGGDLPGLLAAIAGTLAESLGYRTVAVNLYRRAWDDVQVVAVHGNEIARTHLLGRTRTVAVWRELLDDRFERCGAYVVPAGSFEWSTDVDACTYIPDGPPGSGADAWHPEDALFVPMRHSDGHLLGVLSVDEPVDLRRPTDEQLEVLVALGDHAALAVQAAQESAEAARHRLALERLLGVSSRLTAQPRVDEILREVCTGIRDALGFQNVLATLREGQGDELRPRAAVGWRLEEIALGGPVHLREVDGLLDPSFEIAGCYLVPRDEVQRRVQLTRQLYVSELNGRGPWAWDHHKLLVPLHDAAGEVIGILWADEPDDRLLPTHERLQALRVFANQAGASVIASAHLHEVRFLAEHDPLTRLLNRRAFVARLDGEVARAARHGHSLALAVCDLDRFKELNDRLGHAAGDEALHEFARTLEAALRRGDEAFRIGGDEFAVLLPDASEADARGALGRVVAQAEGVRASFGVASCPENARDAETLFRLADGALYEAKRAGGGLRFVA